MQARVVRNRNHCGFVYVRANTTIIRFRIDCILAEEMSKRKNAAKANAAGSGLTTRPASDRIAAFQYSAPS